MKIVTDPSEVQPQAFGVLAAARYLGISEHQMRRLIKAKRIRARHTGASYIIARAVLDEFLAGHDEPMRHPDSA